MLLGLDTAEIDQADTDANREGFIVPAKMKITDDIAAQRTDLSPSKEKVFLNGIHHSIDQMLHSGSVIYGDEISLYVEAVAKNLLREQYKTLFA